MQAPNGRSRGARRARWGIFPHPDQQARHERREGDGGSAACGAQVAATLRISGPDRVRKVDWVRGSGLIRKENDF
jgi:hypothetical protein